MCSCDLVLLHLMRIGEDANCAASRALLRRPRAKLASLLALQGRAGRAHGANALFAAPYPFSRTVATEYWHRSRGQG